MTDRQWTDADRERVAQAIRDHNPPEAWQATAPLIPADHWAGAALEALTAAGWRPPDGMQDIHQQLTQAKLTELEERLELAQEDAARAHARVAELEQQLADRSCRMCHGSHLVHDGMGAGPCPACSVDGRPQPGWERQFCGTTAPAEPEPECDGLCLTGADIGVPGPGVAYAHPGCPAHDPDQVCGCGNPDRCLSPTHGQVSHAEALAERHRKFDDAAPPETAGGEHA